MALKSFLLATAFLTIPMVAVADPADEARRQAQMQSSRDSAAAIDRRNADQAFQQGLARSSASNPSSSSSSSSASSSGGSSTLPGGKSNASAYDGRSTAEGYNRSTGTITVNVSGGGGAAAARAAVATVGANNLSQSAARLGREVAAGNAQSQYLLGRMTYAGYGVSANETEARRLFVAAANQRHVEASAYAGQFLVYGKGGPVDMARGMSYLETAAQAGNNDAKSMLGVRYMTTAFETGNNANMPRAIQYLEQAAEAGNAVAQAALGTTIYLYGVGGVAQDRTKALKYLRMGAQQGEVMSLRELGVMMVTGSSSTQPNFAEGWPLIARAIQLGDGDAMALLGLAKLRGNQGQAQNLTEGADLMRRSAEASSATGLYVYGDMLRFGEYVAKNEVLGINYTRRAAELNDPDAQIAMGRMSYLGDVGIPKNFVEAARWFRLGANGGSAAGQMGMGQIYSLGHGVPLDMKEAVRWFRRAAAQGYQNAINELAKPEMVAVARTMTD